MLTSVGSKESRASAAESKGLPTPRRTGKFVSLKGPKTDSGQTNFKILAKAKILGLSQIFKNVLNKLTSVESPVGLKKFLLKMT